MVRDQPEQYIYYTAEQEKIKCVYAKLIKYLKYAERRQHKPTGNMGIVLPVV